MPWPFRRSAVATELATAPLMCVLISASSSMKKFAVDPLPTPTYGIRHDVLDRLAGDLLFLLVLRHAFLRTRRQVGADALERFRGQSDRLAECRMRMNRLADVDRIGAHFHREREFADQVAGMRADDAAADDAMRCPRRTAAW